MPPQFIRLRGALLVRDLCPVDAVHSTKHLNVPAVASAVEVDANRVRTRPLARSVTVQDHDMTVTGNVYREASGCNVTSYSRVVRVDHDPHLDACGAHVVEADPQAV